MTNYGQLRVEGGALRFEVELEMLEETTVDSEAENLEQNGKEALGE